MDNYTPFEFEHFENPDLGEGDMENAPDKMTQIPAPEKAVENILNYSKAYSIRKTSNAELPFVEVILN